MHGEAQPENIHSVIERMVELGFDVHRTTGAHPDHPRRRR